MNTEKIIQEVVAEGIEAALDEVDLNFVSKGDLIELLKQEITLVLEEALGVLYEQEEN